MHSKMKRGDFMIKHYSFFNIRKRIEIDLDDSCTIEELISKVYEKYGFEAKNGLDIVTIYDMNNYHVVTDKKKTLKKENVSSGLCFAYFKKGEFLYVEGGWGHHMIKMDAVSKIKEPFMFYMSFDKVLNDFAFVATKKMTIKSLYEALCKGEHIYNCSYIDVYEVNRGGVSYELLKRINVKDAINNGLTILEIIGEDKLTSTIIQFK